MSQGPWTAKIPSREQRELARVAFEQQSRFANMPTVAQQAFYSSPSEPRGCPVPGACQSQAIDQERAAKLVEAIVVAWMASGRPRWDLEFALNCAGLGPVILQKGSR